MDAHWRRPQARHELRQIPRCVAPTRRPKKRATACRDQAESEEMTVTGLLELEEGAAKLEANARKLPTGPGRYELLQDITRFHAQLAALKARRFTATRRRGGKVKDLG